MTGWRSAWSGGRDGDGAAGDSEGGWGVCAAGSSVSPERFTGDIGRLLSPKLLLSDAAGRAALGGRRCWRRRWSLI